MPMFSLHHCRACADSPEKDYISLLQYDQFVRWYSYNPYPVRRYANVILPLLDLESKEKLSQEPATWLSQQALRAQLQPVVK